MSWISTVIVTAVMGGANNNLCEALDKSYCVKGEQLLMPFNIKNEWRFIICAAVVAVAAGIQKHLAAPRRWHAARAADREVTARSSMLLSEYSAKRSYTTRAKEEQRRT